MTSEKEKIELQKSVRTGLPNLDYSKLFSVSQMGAIKTSLKLPGGKYNTLLTHLKNMVKNKVGKDVDIDPAEIDKRIRNYFEDIITDILKNPRAWEKEMEFSGTELFNYLIEPYIRPVAGK